MLKTARDLTRFAPFTATFAAAAMMGGSAVAADSQTSLTLSGIGGQFAWSKDHPLVATISVGPKSISNLTANVVLTDDSDGHRFEGGNLKICPAPPASCDVVISQLQAGEVKKIAFVKSDGPDPEPGKYTGMLEVISTEAKSPAVQATVTVTSGVYMIGGTVVLLVATAVSFAFSIFVRNRLSKLQLQAPAEALSARLDTIGQAIEKDSFKLSGTRIGDAIKIWREGLAEARLESAGLVPPWWSPNPAAQTNLPGLQQLLDWGGSWASALAHLETLGFSALKAAEDHHASYPQADAIRGIIETARTKLDRLVPVITDTNQAAPTLATFDSAITEAVAAAAAAIAALLHPPALAPSLQAAVSAPAESLESTRYEIKVLSFASLVIAATLTGLVGSDVMVWTHQDFGRWNDFVLCLFWGLGLPFTASQLAQATPASVSASLGVILPKPS